MKSSIYSLVQFALILSACVTSRPPSVLTPEAMTLPAATQPAAALPATLPATLPPTAAIPSPQPTATAIPASPTPAPLHFAVIGDYGEGSQAELDVSNLVKSWNPDIILTVGDNNYPIGAAETIDDRIGQYYSGYIFPYTGAYGPGAQVNRFFPTLGNHDVDTARGQPYLDYFTLPNNERYYDFVVGPVHFFALNSDSREPDGVGMSSVQAQWLQGKLAAASEPWQIVYFHTAPYSSGYQGPVDWMRWPFAEWGADAILTGHDHIYERLLVDGIPYITNGLGGGAIYDIPGPIDPQSQARFNDDYGAMIASANPYQVIFEFYTRTGQLVDTYTISH